MFIHLFQQTKSDYVLDDHYESARFTDYTPWKVIWKLSFVFYNCYLTDHHTAHIYTAIWLPWNSREIR